MTPNLSALGGWSDLRLACSGPCRLLSGAKIRFKIFLARALIAEQTLRWSLAGADRWAKSWEWGVVQAGRGPRRRAGGAFLRQRTRGVARRSGADLQPHRTVPAAARRPL